MTREEPHRQLRNEARRIRLATVGTPIPPGADASSVLPSAIRATVQRSAARQATRRRVPRDKSAPRPRVNGPFLWIGDRKFVVKAVTYGSFAPNPDGEPFPPRHTVRRDFRAMRSANVNTVRTYAPPPVWLLQEARAVGLRVLVGVQWEGRNCTFDDPDCFRQAAEAVRDAVTRCRQHADVVLGYVIGNEIPPLVIRFHGRRVIERFLRRLCALVRDLDPESLVTYATFPSTEFLELDFLDFHTINVYLLEPNKLSRYLDRVLMLAKGKPVLLGEVGEDSYRNGEAHQAKVLEWTIPLALDKGLAGVCVFSWTDDWVVAGHRVTDWRFGLVDEERRPKRAFEVVRHGFDRSPLERRERPWPRVSVVVCNYNGEETLDETLNSLTTLEYPDYEVIYVDDGSTDSSLDIARRHASRVRILTQPNLGLGTARNVGAEAATGDIVAYIDSDAYADPDWLRYLVLAIESHGCVAAGGPNLTPSSDGLTAQFIASCPGNPTFVLKDDVQADHVAGVNMAFRRDALLSVGGFDPVHRKAGDDVDICWRLIDADMRIAFAPTAIVWHHRRSSVLRYLRQQYGYGEAENQLERKHPERFNLGGYIRWNGRVYQAPRRVSSLLRPFIYHGTFGKALFQTLYQKEPSYLMFGPTMIHWYLLWAGLLALAPLNPWLLLVAAGLMLLSLWAAFVQGLTTLVAVPLNRAQRIQKVCVVTLLHFLHPIVRWWGRLRHRLGHGRRPDLARCGFSPHDAVAELRHVLTRRKQIRSYPTAVDREAILRSLQRELKCRHVSVTQGNEWSNHDLHLNGAFAAEGRIFSAPDRWDTALCVGFKACMAEPARFAFLASLVAAFAAMAATVWGSILFLVPLAIAYCSLGQRARLRRVTWLAVDGLMARAGDDRCRNGVGA